MHLFINLLTFRYEHFLFPTKLESYGNSVRAESLHFTSCNLHDDECLFSLFFQILRKRINPPATLSNVHYSTKLKPY